MSVQITSPSPAPPLKSGLQRHQYLLILGKNDLMAELDKNPNALSEILESYFGSMMFFAEAVMTGDYYAWHVWYDFKEGEFEKNLENPEEEA